MQEYKDAKNSTLRYLLLYKLKSQHVGSSTRRWWDIKIPIHLTQYGQSLSPTLIVMTDESWHLKLGQIAFVYFALIMMLWMRTSHDTCVNSWPSNNARNINYDFSISSPIQTHQASHFHFKHMYRFFYLTIEVILQNLHDPHVAMPFGSINETF